MHLTTEALSRAAASRVVSKPVDEQIGSRVRLYRNAAGLSQEKLAAAVNVTFQQIQKYEKGTNRIGGSRLVQIAAAIGVSPGVLLGESSPATMPPNVQQALDFLSSPGGQRMTRALRRLNGNQLSAVLAVAELLGAEAT